MRPGEKRFLWLQKVETHAYLRCKSSIKKRKIGSSDTSRQSFKKWASESATLAAHLIENEERADVSLWEKANAVVELKNEIEASRGASLTSRALKECFRGVGGELQCRCNSVFFLFAVEMLAPIGRFFAGRRSENSEAENINGHKTDR